jgi:hypothetical protein
MFPGHQMREREREGEQDATSVLKYFEQRPEQRPFSAAELPLSAKNLYLFQM